MREIKISELPKLLKRKHKYGVAEKPDRTWKGIVFPSKRQMEDYKRMEAEADLTPGMFLLREVPFRLPARTTYWADLVVFRPVPSHAGAYTVEVRDAKGKHTQTYRLKKRQVEHFYPVRIIEV